MGSVIGVLALLCILSFVLFRIRQSRRKGGQCPALKFHEPSIYNLKSPWSKQADETPVPFYPQRQKSLPPLSQPLTPYGLNGILSVTSESEPSSNLTRSTSAPSQIPPPLINVTSMGPDPLSRNRPLHLPLPSLPEKSRLDSPQPLTVAIPSHPSVDPITPSSFSQNSAIDDDRPPSYQPDSR